MRLKDRTGRVTVSGSIIVGIVIAALLVMALYVYVLPELVERREAKEEKPAEEKLVRTLPIKFALRDPLANTSPSWSGTVKVYGAGAVELESLTLSSSGFAVTTGKYKSGTELLVQIQPSGYVKQWLTITVPYAESAEDNEHYVTIDATKQLTPSVKVSKPDGATIDNNGTYSKASSGSKPTLTFELRNTLDDSGWVESYDPQLGLTYRVVFYIKLSEQGTGNDFEKVVVTSGMKYKGWSSSRVWYKDVPASTVIRDVAPDGTVRLAGIWNVQVTLDLTACTLSPDNVIVEYGAVLYTSSDWYDTYGAWDPTGTLTSTTWKKFTITA